MASTNAKHGSLPKSIWKTAESWFSIRTHKSRTGRSELDPAANRESLPTSGLATGTLKGLNPKSKFLAFAAKLTVVGGRESHMIRTAGDGFVSSHG